MLISIGSYACARGQLSQHRRKNIKEHMHIQHSVCRQNHLPPCGCPCARARPNEIECVVAETTSKVIRMCPAQQKRYLYFFVGEGGVLLILIGLYACARGRLSQNRRKTQRSTCTDNTVFAVMIICLRAVVRARGRDPTILNVM